MSSKINLNAIQFNSALGTQIFKHNAVHICNAIAKKKARFETKPKQSSHVSYVMYIRTDRQNLKTKEALRFVNTTAEVTVCRTLDPDMSVELRLRY